MTDQTVIVHSKQSFQHGKHEILACYCVIPAENESPCGQRRTCFSIDLRLYHASAACLLKRWPIVRLHACQITTGRPTAQHIPASLQSVVLNAIFSCVYARPVLCFSIKWRRVWRLENVWLSVSWWSRSFVNLSYERKKKIFYDQGKNNQANGSVKREVGKITALRHRVLYKEWRLVTQENIWGSCCGCRKLFTYLSS